MCFEKVQNKVEKLPRWTVSDRLTHWHAFSSGVASVLLFTSQLIKHDQTTRKPTLKDEGNPR